MTAYLTATEWRQLSLFKGKRQKGERLPTATEFRMQCALADLLRYSAHPDWWWTAFPAGEHRTAATGARLKRMGLRPGVSDFIFISPDGRFLGLELKRRGGRLSEAQQDFHLWCLDHNIPYEIAQSYNEAVAILKTWGALP